MGARATWLAPYYGSQAWRKRSAAFLRVHPECAHCGERSEVTDHVEPPRNLDEFWRPQRGYQPLCKSCHSRKTARFDRPSRHGHSGCDVEGMPLDGSKPWAT